MLKVYEPAILGWMQDRADRAAGLPPRWVHDPNKIEPQDMAECEPDKGVRPWYIVERCAFELCPLDRIYASGGWWQIAILVPPGAFRETRKMLLLLERDEDDDTTLITCRPSKRFVVRYR